MNTLNVPVRCHGRVAALAVILGLGILGLADSWAVGNTGEANVSKTLTQSEREGLLTRLSQLPMDAPGDLAEKRIADENANRPIAPYLCQIIKDEEKPCVIRCRAMWVLGHTKDPEGISTLESVIDRPLKENMSSDEWQLLHNAILCLGLLADDATLDLLFEMAKEDYWVARNPQAAEKRCTPESFRKHMRLMALNGIAFSGSERAIRAFTTKEGVPEDMYAECGWLLKCATLRSKGLILDPDAPTKQRRMR